MPAKGGFFYGWIIAIACFALTFAVGVGNFSFGLFFKPIEMEFNWTRAIISSAQTAYLLSYAASAFIMGRLSDRYGPRPILALCALLTASGFYLASKIENIWELRLCLALAGFGLAPCWTIPGTTVQRWFIKRRGLVLGLVIAGVGIGGFISAPTINHLISLYTWRGAYASLSLFYLFTISSVAAVMVHSPQRMGLRPYGEEEMKITPLPGLTTIEAIRSQAFLAVALVQILGVMGFQIVLVHLVPYVRDIGISPAIAATALGLMLGFSALGRILMGVIAERIGWQRGWAISNFGAGAMCFYLLGLKGVLMLYPFVIIYGFFHGARVVSGVGTVGFFFGSKSLTEILGIVTTIAMISGAFAPYIAGFIFDKTGSYFLPFLLTFSLFSIAGIISLIMKPLSNPQG